MMNRYKVLPEQGGTERLASKLELQSSQGLPSRENASHSILPQGKGAAASPPTGRRGTILAKRKLVGETSPPGLHCQIHRWDEGGH